MNNFLRNNILQCVRRSHFLKRNYNIRYLSCTTQRKSEINEHTFPYEYKKWYEKSLQSPGDFWGALGKKKITWIEDFHTVTDSNIVEGKHQWFVGGKLNASGRFSF